MLLNEEIQKTQQVVKPRKTYSQVWSSYNLAQTTEKSRFLELLFQLCSEIEDIPRKDGAGRNRIPLSDMVFAVVYKTYAMVSGRRFMSDLKEAKQKGYISTIPHFNSLYNYLELEEVFYILHDFIKKSARPLKSVEFEFAVDSSGFSKGVTEKWLHAKHSRPHIIDKRQWLKCNLICGVKTHIISSVEISSATSADTNYFPQLVESTAKTFTVNLVFADKAYLSAKNFRVVEKVGGMPYIPFRENSNPNHRTKDTFWRNMYYFFQLHRETFKAHYHKRSNAETVFSMIKRKFGEKLKSKTEKAQINELLCKILCHNLTCLIQSMYELGLDVDFYND